MHIIARRSLILLSVVTLLSPSALSSAAPTPSNTLRSGTEGAKAAMVRIELQAAAEIAHIDHTTGEVEIARSRSTVPLGYATGVLTSADGIVATTWGDLTIDEGAVAVYAANELFANVIKVPVVGNEGDPARRGSTPDPYWKPHLQHCYDQVTHCVLFRVPQYHVRTYTSEPGGVMAELLNTPSQPQDVALLRISGGGGAPTAPLASADATPGADTALFGFKERPTSQAGPIEIPVTVDAAAGRINSQEDLIAPLNAGLAGGPVVDRATGQVLGLTGAPQQDGSAALVPAAAIQAAMTQAGVEASSSKFDAVFRRGVDHLASGNPGGSAESALEESLTYYDSALATSHLEQARALGRGQATNDPATVDTDEEGSLWAMLLPILAGILLVAGIIVVIALRRRGVTTPANGGIPSPGTTQPPPARAASVIPADQARAHNQRSARATAPGAVPQQAVRQQADRERTEAAIPQSPAPWQSPTPAVPAPPTRDAKANPSMRGDETRTAGWLAPRAADTPPVFCTQCGRSVVPGGRFCAGCGHPVG